MKMFKDAKGNEWNLEITFGAARRVKAKAGIDLLQLVDKKMEGLDNLLKDPYALLGVLYLLLQQQAEAKGISEDAFVDGFIGETIFDATQHFMEEYANFFPNPKIRDSLKSVFQKTLNASLILSSELKDEIDKVTPEQIVKTLKEQYGNLPES